MTITLFCVGIVVFLTHALEAVTGFGCTALAFPFVTFLLDIATAKVILSILAWLLALYFVITKFKSINFRQFGIIFGFVVVGFPIGIYAFNTFKPDMLKFFLGIFIIITASIQLIKAYSKREKDILPGWMYYVILFCGGIIHGAFASGGPLIVLYATRKLKDKGEFRATLCLLWTTLNTLLFFVDPTFSAIFKHIRASIFHGAAVTPDMISLFWMFPFLFVGIIAGEFIHNRVNADMFKKIVFWVLLLTGIFMVIAPYLPKH